MEERAHVSSKTRVETLILYTHGAGITNEVQVEEVVGRRIRQHASHAHPVTIIPRKGVDLLRLC